VGYVKHGAGVLKKTTAADLPEGTTAAAST
jgi:hypothetical protein